MASTREALGQTQAVEDLPDSQIQTAIPRQCTPGGIYMDFEGDMSENFLDIGKVETSLEGETLTVTMYLRKLPKEITIDFAEAGREEYSWGVSIDIDNDPWTGKGSTGIGVEYFPSIIPFFPGGRSANRAN